MAAGRNGDACNCDIFPYTHDRRISCPPVAPPQSELDGILRERGSRYGPFLHQAGLSQRIKREIFGVKPRSILHPDQVEALDMIAVKISRIITGDADYVDNWDDIAGYALLVANRLKNKEKADAGNSVKKAE